MSLARVVTFEGVDADSVEAVKAEIESGERPEGLPATEFLLLHDPSSDRSMAVVFFDSEEDYAVGDATLDAMPRGDTPGTRTSVTKYEVVTRVTM